MLNSSKISAAISAAFPVPDSLSAGMLFSPLLHRQIRASRFVPRTAPLPPAWSFLLAVLHRLSAILYFSFFNLYIFVDKFIRMRYNAVVMGEHGSPVNSSEGNDLFEKDII